jgi:hypothetical protein
MLPDAFQGLRGPAAALAALSLCFATGLALRTRLILQDRLSRLAAC